MTKSEFKIQEHSTTTIDVNVGIKPGSIENRKYKDSNDAYEAAINYIATQDVKSHVTIIQTIELRRIK
jgi:hypothetical protein